jgi:dephospho-CoA kinase
MRTPDRGTSPLIIGILGGIGSGKSTVARLFTEVGAHVIDADEISQAVLEEPEVRTAVRRALGDDVIRPDGVIDRKVLARKVFGSPGRLGLLTDIVHPLVRDRVRARLDSLGPEDTVVLDIPLLAESPFLEDCHRLVFVEASRRARLARVRQGRGWEPEEMDSREGHQTPLDTKRQMAHLWMENEGTLDEARAEVSRVWKEIVEWRRSAQRKPRPA